MNDVNARAADVGATGRFSIKEKDLVGYLCIACVCVSERERERESEHVSRQGSRARQSSGGT